MQLSRTPSYLLCLLLIAGCTSIKPSDKHISSQDAAPTQGKDIPPPVSNSIALAPPKPPVKTETYSVVVTNVPVAEILFALARDAKINLDIYPGIQGNVTLNAINQTLPQILDRITRQVDMRYELNGPNLAVLPDTPFLKQYKIDYLNMDRDAQGGITNTTQVGGGAANPTGTTAPTPTAGGAAGANNSQLAIKNSSKNHFWETLVQNIKDILRETDKVLPAGSSETVIEQNRDINTTGTGAQGTGGRKASRAPGMENSPLPGSLQEGATTVTRTNTFREAASVIANPETGIITVRATGKQHEKIQQFVDNVMTNARRQVLIEVTIAEVTLSKNYQQGINWSKLLAAGTTKGFSFTQALTGTNPIPPGANTGGYFLMNYVNPTSKLGNLAASVSLLESFGDVKVLSSPKLSVMNNQTAMLRVVNNFVYFQVEAKPSGTVTTGTVTTTSYTYTTTPQTTPIGFTMSLTPQISDSDSVLINLRPTITRLTSVIKDPNPDLAKAGVTNFVPVTQTREIESLLKIENNQIAVLGGLMQDEANRQSSGIPLLADIPVIGNAFKDRNDTTSKTELVIFIRPTVIHSGSVNDDFSQFRNNLPNDHFLEPGDNTHTLPKP